jgi:hypothetical protein
MDQSDLKQCAFGHLRFHPTDGEPRAALFYDGPPDWDAVRAAGADPRVDAAVDLVLQAGADVVPVTSFGVGHVELLRVTRSDVVFSDRVPHILYIDVATLDKFARMFTDPPRRAPVYAQWWFAPLMAVAALAIASVAMNKMPR